MKRGNDPGLLLDKKCHIAASLGYLVWKKETQPKPVRHVMLNSLKKLWNAGAKNIRHLRHCKPTLEVLEERALMTTMLQNGQLHVFSSRMTDTVDLVTIDRHFTDKPGTDEFVVEFVVTERQGATWNAAMHATPSVYRALVEDVQEILVETYGGPDEIDIESVSGSNTIAISHVEIDAGDGNDIIRLSPTSKDLSLQQADDFVDGTADYIVNGGEGDDNLSLNDQRSSWTKRYDVRRNEIAFSNTTPINFTDVENVTLYTDTYASAIQPTVQVLGSPNFLTLETGARFRPTPVIVADMNNSLDSFGAARIHVNGHRSGATLTIKDSSTSSQTYMIGETNGGSIKRTGGPVINYSGLLSVKLDTGSRSDTVNIYATPITPLTVDGGSGSGADTLLLSEPWHATWRITGANSGTLNTKTTFHNFENLTGSAGRDRFVFSPGATLSGFILGGGGWDTLDYSAFSTSVTVNLYNGVAHTHGVSQVEMVLGGSANDLFTGSNANEAFVGGRGADRINGGGGKDLLIGGLDADILDGGAGEDIVIGGITNFDAIDAALASIMAEWARPFTTYEERVAKLEAGVSSGGTQVALVRNVTVFKDDSQDTLRGGAGVELDYFFTDLGQPILFGGTVHYVNGDLTPDWVSGEKKR